MKKIILMVMLSCMTIFAFPSVYGGSGSFMVNTAESDASAILGISAYSYMYSKEDTIYSLFPIGLTWTPLKWAELSFVPGPILTMPNTFDTMKIYWDDIRLKLKIALPVLKVLKPAGIFETDILTGDTAFFHRTQSGGEG